MNNYEHALLGWFIFFLFFMLYFTGYKYYMDTLFTTDKLQGDFSKYNATGLYYGSKQFYCVWIQNRDPINIKMTEAHEICHHLTKINKTHFCGVQGSGE